MAKYKVLNTFRGSPDGCLVNTYSKDQLLEENTNFPKDLIDVALAEGWVEVVKLKVVKKKVTRKQTNKGTK